MSQKIPLLNKKLQEIVSLSPLDASISLRLDPDTFAPVEDAEYYVKSSDETYIKTTGKDLLKVIGDTDGQLADAQTAEIDIAVRADHSKGMEALKGFFSEAVFLGLDKPFLRSPKTPEEALYEKRRQEIFGSSETLGRVTGNILPFVAGGFAGLARGVAKKALKTAGKAPSALVFKGADKFGELTKKVAKTAGLKSKRQQAVAGAVGVGLGFSAIEGSLRGVKTGISTYKTPKFTGDKKVKSTMSEALQAGAKSAGETFSSSAILLSSISGAVGLAKLGIKGTKEAKDIVFGPGKFGAEGLRSAFFRISTSPSGRKGREILNRFIARKSDSHKTAMNKLMDFVNKEGLGKSKDRIEMLEKIGAKVAQLGERIDRERNRAWSYWERVNKSSVQQVKTKAHPYKGESAHTQKIYTEEVKLKEVLIDMLEKTRVKGVRGQTILKGYNTQLDKVLEQLKGPATQYRTTRRPPGPTTAKYQAGTKMQEKTVTQHYLKSSKAKRIDKPYYKIGSGGQKILVKGKIGTATTKPATTTRKTFEEIPDIKTRPVVTGKGAIKTEIKPDVIRGINPRTLKEVMDLFSRYAKYAKREKGELAIDLKFRRAYNIVSRLEDILYWKLVGTGLGKGKKLPPPLLLRELKDRFAKLKDLEEIVKNASASELRKIHGWDRILLGGAGGALGAGIPGAIAGVGVASAVSSAQNIGYRYLKMADYIDKINSLTRKIRTPKGVKNLLNKGSQIEINMSVPTLGNLLLRRGVTKMEELSDSLNKMEDWDKTSTGFEDLFSMVYQYGGSTNFSQTAVNLSRLKRNIIKSFPTPKVNSKGEMKYSKEDVDVFLKDLDMWVSPFSFVDSLKKKKMTKSAYQKFGDLYPNFISHFNLNFHQAIKEGVKDEVMYYYKTFLNSTNSDITNLLYSLMEYPEQRPQKGSQRKMNPLQPTVSENLQGGVG